MARLPFVRHLPVGKLRHKYRACRHPVEKPRWHALWLLARADVPRTPAQVADVVGLSAVTVRAVLHRWNDHGPGGVGDRRSGNGADPKLTPRRRDALYAALQKRPPDGGLWTGPKVAKYVRDRWQVAVRPETGWRWLRNLGFTHRVPRRSHPKAADPPTRRAWKKPDRPGLWEGQFGERECRRRVKERGHDPPLRKPVERRRWTMARRCSTVCLPICKDDYLRIVGSPAHFRAWIDRAFRDSPELFPEHFARGYTLRDIRTSKRLGIRIRRVRPKATRQAFSVRPSFAFPSMTGLTDRVEGPLFLRTFGVPFWARARVFGRGPMYWYRPEVGLGRNSTVGTTLRKAEWPEHLLADEHHQTRDGVKNYVATTVGDGCCLGAALARTAGVEDLQTAYGVFKREAQDARKDYQPRTVNADGWASTRQAWLGLFSLAVVLRCFLHGWLAIRSRGKLSEGFATLSEKVWDAYRAPDRRSFAQRLRRLWEWAEGRSGTAWVLDRVKKLCSRAGEYGEAYRQAGGHRTSNMLDRVMRRMSRYFEDGQHLHGGEEAGDRHCRAWALLFNFRPWNPATTRANGGWRSPAERVNRHRYRACTFSCVRV